MTFRLLVRLFLVPAALTFTAFPNPARADDPAAVKAEPPAEARPEAKKAADPPSPTVTADPPVDDFMVIPLRVHLLQAPDLPELNCALTDADLARIVKKVNAIWHRAGVHWGVESVVREPAAEVDKFKEAKAKLERPGNLNLYRMIRPEPTRSFEGLHVYYLHRFAVNGVYLGSDYAIVQETARLREVEGGIDEPIPRVTAHELGHALSLPHRQDRTNLLASGTTGTSLNEREVERAREKAVRTKGVIRFADLRKRAADAEATNDLNRARSLWTWLGELPGLEAEAKTHLEALFPKEAAR